ncbi:MAG: FkbM family methyltransferase [Bacteroidales bacterium]|jgi:hypothetical protein|nr:FkbM family methyltransferase [Bacteroidales bacterium]
MNNSLIDSKREGNFVICIYRSVLPSSLRIKIYKSFLKAILDVVRGIKFFIKTRWFYLISYFSPLKNEKHLSYSFMGKYGKTQYPFVPFWEYQVLTVDVFIDSENQMPYVIHCSKKLYFPKNTDKSSVIEMYKVLLTEQNEKSAHRYVDSYERFTGKVLLDIGAAEGIIALDAIDKVKFVYLFEYDTKWVEALEATFAPYKHKVEIIKKYVSDTNNEMCISLDTFFKDKSIDDLFIKMDIEGAELNALHGGSFVLKNAKNLDFSICLYHKPEDEYTIPAFLKSCGHEYVVSQGFIFMDWWLRKGVVRKLIK